LSQEQEQIEICDETKIFTGGSNGGLIYMFIRDEIPLFRQQVIFCRVYTVQDWIPQRRVSNSFSYVVAR